MRESDPLRATSETYDRISADYERQTDKVEAEFVAFRAAFARRLTKGAVVVDVGCGPGRDAAFFASRGIEIIGMDASETMAARVAGKRLAALQGDLRSLPLATGRLDALWSSASLLHVPRAGTLVALSDWRRSLRRGGWLGLTTSIGDDEGWETVPYGPGYDYGDQKLDRWFVHRTPEETTEALTRAGFQIVESSQRTGHRVWFQVIARAV